MTVVPGQTFSGGNGGQPSWELGVVEVEFRDEVRPEISAAETGLSPEIRSFASVDLSGLNQVLQQYQLERVEFSLQTSPDEADQVQASARQQGIQIPNLRNFVRLYFPQTANVQSIAQELNNLSVVERAVPVPKAAPPQIPLNEPLLGTSDQVVVDPATGLQNQWYIFRSQANNAWSISSGNGVVIADIDWGFLTTHQDLKSRFDLSRAYNSYDGGTNVSYGDVISHGTGVTGFAGAAYNDLGMVGFAFEATLWPIQANTGPGVPIGGDSWARAIEWVRTADSGNKRKVIILEVQTGSLGNFEMVPSTNAAIRTAIASGVVVCVAAGNGDRDAGIDDQGDTFPETGSILVGATAYHETKNERAWFSNYGSRIVVSAPGDPSYDLTCGIASDYAYVNNFGGTSGSTPKVAGTVALMLAVNPYLTHSEIREILNKTGTPIITDASKPVGTFLNSQAAVQEARKRAK